MAINKNNSVSFKNVIFNVIDSCGRLYFKPNLDSVFISSVWSHTGNNIPSTRSMVRQWTKVDGDLPFGTVLPTRKRA